MTDETELTGYDEARSSAAFRELPGWGWLRLTGRDRLELLHRLSTNAVKTLSPGAGAVTVFTSPTGRVLALVTLYTGDDETYLRTAPEQAAGVTRYLNSLIFWQDQVEVADLTAEVCQFALYGPKARTALERALGISLSGLTEYGWRTGTAGAATVAAHRSGALEPFAWTLVAPSAARESLRAALADLPELSFTAAETLRVEKGLPAWGRELSEEVTPLETGLLPAISYNKGCYTGQEIIARQTNYDKVTRNLVGLEFAAEATRFLGDTGLTRPGEPLARVLGPGRGGFVATIAYSPALNRTIALAVVPRELAAPGTEVEIERGEERLKATVRSLPFIAR